MRHSSNQSRFAQGPQANIPRSKFKRDSNLHTTIDAGYLVPIFVDECVPGDTYIMKDHIFGRLATPLKPLMDNLYLDTFYFFVPTRLVQTNWEKVMGAKDSPSDTTEYLCPTVSITNAPNGSIFDYMGLPTNVAGAITVNANPLRCYNEIYNEWFRDGNLQEPVTVSKDDGPDASSEFTLLRRGKRHDYFTSCLPSPQRGDAVSLPLGTTAPVLGIGKQTQNYSGVNQLVYEADGTTSTYASSFLVAPGDQNTNLHIEKRTDSNYPNIRADLSNATAATINELREAFQIQGLFERDMQGGTRINEIIRAHYGVTTADARLQRPEYLGGNSTRIGIAPVANTSATATEKQGDLTGMGIVSGQGGFTYSATEHGYILGLVSLRADLNYQQGLNRMWTRQERLDFYHPALAHLGEQAVLNSEIFAQGTAADSQVFGYNERWSEMKYRPNQITGKFRSNDAGSLDAWHLAQDFSTAPALNATFIQENPPMSRVIAVTSEPHLLLDCYFDLDCVRPMPMYAIPGLISKF